MASKWVLLITVAVLATGEPNKLAAVDKVIEMLEDLQQKVIDEGTREAETYEKFACFCKDGIAEKQEAIQAGEDQKAKLAAETEDDSAEREELDEDITDLVATIDQKEKDMKQWTKESKAAHAQYEANAADLRNAIKGLEGAKQVMKVNKAATPSFLQLPEEIKETIRSATLMADALGLTSGKAVASLLQAPSLVAASSKVQKIEPYAFQGDDIIGTLEQLETDFRKEKENLDSAEKARKEDYDQTMHDTQDLVETKDTDLGGKKGSKSNTEEEIATESQDYTETNAQLTDDKRYLQELAQTCSDKKVTYDQRIRIRTDELSALTMATGIIKTTVAEKTSAATVRLIQQKLAATRAQVTVHDEDTMEAIEADAEEQEQPLGFLQKRKSSPLDRVHMAEREMQKEFANSEKMTAKPVQEAKSAAPAEDGRSQIMSLLRQQGLSIKSSMLVGLADKIAANPFAKVKKLIQELIERSLQEAANEANQKGWCDKATADAEQKRGHAAEKLATINSAMAKLESKRDKLHEQIDTLGEELAALAKHLDEARTDRAEEKDENHHTVEEAKAGLEAVNQAIDVLNDFYKKAGTQEVLLKGDKVKARRLIGKKGEAIKGDKGTVSEKSDVEFTVTWDRTGMSSKLSTGDWQKKVEKVEAGNSKHADEPDTEFESGKAYKGNQGASKGIIAMMEVISGDFVRTVQETEKAEAQAQDDHHKFETDTQTSLAVKTQAEEIKNRQKDDTLEKLSEESDNMDAQTEILQTAIQELNELKPACVDTSMSYEERTALREEEIESLKKAICMVDAFAEFGPDKIPEC